MRTTQSRCREMYVVIMEDALNIDRSESHGYFYYHFCFSVIKKTALRVRQIEETINHIIMKCAEKVLR
jgi:hypothetical protein